HGVILGLEVTWGSGCENGLTQQWGWRGMLSDRRILSLGVTSMGHLGRTQKSQAASDKKLKTYACELEQKLEARTPELAQALEQQTAPSEVLRVISSRQPLNRDWVTGRAVVEARTIHVPDLPNSDEYPQGREMARRHGHRATLAAPLLREGTAIGAILVRRPEVRPFTDKQIALVQTFA